jgi:hypothetical protein
MKKLLLFSAAIAMSATSFAQSNLSAGNSNKNYTHGKKQISRETTVISKGQTNPYGKSTAYTDTSVILSGYQFTQAFVNPVYYNLVSADSGAYFGTNILNRNAYGEWFVPYSYGSDTTLEVIGVLSLWGGTVQPNSTKTINYKIWEVDTTTQTTLAPNVYLVETPGNALYTQSAPITSLTLDTDVTVEYFTAAQVMSEPFYVGYDMTYDFNTLNGDTIGLYATPVDSGWFHGYVEYDTTMSGVDTLLYAQSVFREGTTWGDVFFNDGNNINMSIAPIFHLNVTTNVHGVTKKSLTLFGSYPNPATNGMNIKLSLDKATDVTVKIMDVTGRILNTINENKMTAGEHVIPVQTAHLPAGNYVYLVTTGTGAALASQFTVVK